MMKREPITLQEAAACWQRCRMEDLPRAFFAYDVDAEQSKCVVSYQLKGPALKSLIDQAKKTKDFKFIVHLGLYPAELTGPIQDKPAFALYLQVYKKKADWQEKCHELTWAKNTRFGIGMEDVTKSEANAIPAAGAYLFVQSWLEMPEASLARPFTAAARVMGQRVQAYTFSVDESLGILNDLKASKKNCLYIHLGNGMAVWEHPFSFRPVIEVPGAVTKKSQRNRPANATGLPNEAGDSFYDYGGPIPPGILTTS
jgi:hypothetical protein